MEVFICITAESGCLWHRSVSFEGHCWMLHHRPKKPQRSSVQSSYIWSDHQRRAGCQYLHPETECIRSWWSKCLHIAMVFKIKKLQIHFMHFLSLFQSFNNVFLNQCRIVWPAQWLETRRPWITSVSIPRHVLCVWTGCWLKIPPGTSDTRLVYILIRELKKS